MKSKTPPKRRAVLPVNRPVTHKVKTKTLFRNRKHKGDTHE